MRLNTIVRVHSAVSVVERVGTVEPMQPNVWRGQQVSNPEVSGTTLRGKKFPSATLYRTGLLLLKNSFQLYWLYWLWRLRNAFAPESTWSQTCSPPHTQPCNSYHWMAWSSYGCCSVSCGAGVRTRSRKCREETEDRMTFNIESRNSCKS